MNKAIVVYTSETGFTKKYAGWIAEALGCQSVRSSEVTKEKLKSYETVIYGGGFYAGQIKGLKKFRELVEKERLIVYATGATPAEQKEIVEKAIGQNLTEDDQKVIPVFYFQSGLDYNQMSFKYKMMMKAFCAMMSKKKDKTEEEKVMVKWIGSSFDESSPEYIQPLLEKVREYGQVKQTQEV